MKVLVATDAHVFRTKDGSYWTTAIYGYTFWKRYLNIFNSVRVLARCKEVDKTENLIRLDGERIEAYEIPFFQGPKQLSRAFGSIQNRLKNAYSGCDAAIFRMPSQTAQMALWHKPKKMPFAGEIVYDPTDDLTNPDSGFIQKNLDRIISWQLKHFCRTANGVSYVTEHTIQNHYPNSAMINGESEYFFQSYYSSISLGVDAFTGPRDYLNGNNLTLVLSDVSMGSERKGEIILFKAMKEVVDKGYDVNALIIGDGPLKKNFENAAAELGLGNRVLFTGRLPSAIQVREAMMNADMFVFPTTAEGLPRGILEAMAIGMPVLSTPVGGIPEVLDKEYLFSPTDYHGFAAKIEELIKDRNKLNDMSKKNFEKALEYKSDILQKRRDEFYKKLRSLTER